MENKDIVMAVRRMQAFINLRVRVAEELAYPFPNEEGLYPLDIEKSPDAEITLKMLGHVAGYSPWYSSVIFKKLTGKSPFEYIRQLRLSKAALKLRDENTKIIDVALQSEFETHEGFTRAFTKQFNMTPKAYAENLPPIKLFMPYPVELKKNKGVAMENKKTYPVFVHVVDRPKRKLVISRGIKAEDYFAYCEEVSCDVWGMLLSIKEATCEPVGMWLPKKFRKPNTSEYCQGVEVPLEFNKALPEGYETIEFPPCKMMIFQGQPFNDEDFEEAIDSMWQTIAEYNPKINGYEWADDDAPRIQMEPRGERGYIEAKPVREM